MAPRLNCITSHVTAACLVILLRPNRESHLGLLLITWFNLIPAWISNYIHCKEWGEIIYPLLDFNGETVEV